MSPQSVLKSVIPVAFKPIFKSATSVAYQRHGHRPARTKQIKEQAQDDMTGNSTTYPLVHNAMPI